MDVKWKNLCVFYLGCMIITGCGSSFASPNQEPAQIKESYSLVKDPLTGVMDDYRSIPQLRQVLPLNVKEADELTYSERKEVECLAWNLYFEIRGGKLNEQIAIAYVPINRIGKPEFASSVCGNIFQYHMVYGRMKYQFSWVGRKFNRNFKIDPDAWQKMQQLAIGVYNKNIKDSGKGSTYFSSVKVNQGWSEHRQKLVLGSTVFWRGHKE
jgi:spore germination cell wall hydrolase CwlJ-like protein